MTIGKKMVLLVTLALGVVGFVVLAQTAGATHVRPKGAPDMDATLVPAYKSCASPNSTHGTPLAFPSCTPPVQASDYLTVGTPDANGAVANSTGQVSIDAVLGPPGGPPPSDVNVGVNITDVHCRPGGAPAVCVGNNTGGGPDYSGEIQPSASLRLTDHENGPGLTEPATVVDIPFQFTGTCARTWKVAIGSTCSATTSVNAIVPGAVKTNKRIVVEIDQVKVFDGGADGAVNSTGNTLFEVQGVFAP